MGAVGRQAWRKHRPPWGARCYGCSTWAPPPFPRPHPSSLILAFSCQKLSQMPGLNLLGLVGGRALPRILDTLLINPGDPLLTGQLIPITAPPFPVAAASSVTPSSSPHSSENVGPPLPTCLPSAGLPALGWGPWVKFTRAPVPCRGHAIVICPQRVRRSLLDAGRGPEQGKTLCDYSSLRPPLHIVFFGTSFPTHKKGQNSDTCLSVILIA